MKDSSPSAKTIAEMAEQVVQQCRVDPRLALRTAEEAVRLADELGDVLSHARAWRALGNALHVGDRNTEAMERYQQAAEMFFSLGEELEAARTLSSQVMPLALLGQYDLSLQRAAEARAIFERLGETARVARLEINCGNIFHRLDRFQEALACYDRALAGIDREADPEAAAAILSNRATSLITLSRFHDALACYNEARDFCQAHSMGVLVAQADYNIAYLHFLRGEYSRAIEMLNQARANFTLLDNAYHLALCDLDESEICLELNLYQDAARLAENARGRFELLGMGYEAAKTLCNQAVASQYSGNSTRALELFGRAGELFAREQNQVWVHIVHLYRALVYLQMGRAYEALQLASELCPYFEEQGVRTKAVYARLLMAQAHFSLGDLELAETECSRARNGLVELEAPWLSFHCHFQLGRIFLAQGRRDAAHQNYRQALLMLEAMRSHIQFDELKIAFIKDKLQAFESFVLLCLDFAAEEEIGHAAPEASAETMRQEAFRAIEQAKSRSVASLVSRPIFLPGGADSSSGIVARMHELREELNWYYKKINLEEFQPRSSYHGNPVEFIQTIRERETELLKLFRQLPPEEQYGALPIQPPASLEEIQEVLPPDGQMLEFYMAEGTVLACLIDHRGLRFFPELSVASRLERLLRLLRFQMSKVTLGDVLSPFAQRMQESALAHLRELYQELIEPLALHLDGNNLVIVPHGFLHYLPFHALFDGQHHLFERHAISYAPSATLFRSCALRRPRPGEHSVILEVSTDATPHIPVEVEQVARLLPRAEVFRGPAATTDCLRARGSTARFLHIASHAIFRHDNPLFSSIQLGDGLLTLLDVYKLRLNCELTTLSGCGTGMNLVLAGDELVGLVRGFLFAGSASLLVSLWDVDDETTAMLMTRFYAAIKDGTGKAEALRQAILATRNQRPHPFYWAPFVLVGQI